MSQSFHLFFSEICNPSEFSLWIKITTVQRDGQRTLSLKYKSAKVSCFLPRVDNVEFILDSLQAFRCSCHYLTRDIPTNFDKLNHSSSSLVLFLITRLITSYLCLMKPRLRLLISCPSVVSSAYTISNSQNIIKIWVLLTLHKAVWILLETLQSFL